MKTRQELEQDEVTTLKPYAVTAQSSLGRKHKEDEHPYRSAFQRDLARVVHTSAFRRLEYKTQVFVNHEGDYYRTRLTHSLEVAQISRTIARALGVNEDLTECVSLAHDLGHTPFGHAGQDVMSKLMKDHGGFEHNRQSFRIVTQLENPYPDFPGLNLCYETLEGITKHTQTYRYADGSEFQKLGYPSLEAQIANFGDEIAYNNHDIDDGLKSGLISMDDLQNVAVWKRYADAVQSKYANLTEHQTKRQIVKSVINHFVTDLLTVTTQNIQDRGIQTLEDIRKNGENLIAYSDEAKMLNAELKQFLFQNLYRHHRVERMHTKAVHVIEDLFNEFVKRPTTMPKSFVSSYNKSVPVERIVCDYIAGMTDRFAYAEHAKLFNPEVHI